MLWQTRCCSYSSSSSILISGVEVEAPSLVGDSALLETAVPRAALKLCVAENLSPSLPWSTLGRAFLSGLPTIAAARESKLACRLEEALGADPANTPGSAGESVRCEVSGVEFASGSAECALLSCL